MGNISVMILLFTLCQILHFSKSTLNVFFKQNLFTGEMSDVKNVFCFIQNLNSDFNESVAHDVVGYIISRRSMNHWETVAELYKSQQYKVYMSDPRVIEATGRLTSDTYMSVTWRTTETIIPADYRCDVIIKEMQSEGTLQVLFSYLTSESQSLEIKHEIKNDEARDAKTFTSKRVLKKLHTQLKPNLKEEKVLTQNKWINAHYRKRSLLSTLDELGELNDDLVSDMISLVKKSVNNTKSNPITQNKSKNSTSSNSSLDSNSNDYDAMSRIFTFMDSELNSYMKKLNNTLKLISLLNLENKLNVQRMVSNLDLSNQDRRNHLPKLENFKDELTKALKYIYHQLNTETDIVNILQWPRGTYSLLKSFHGCPSSGNKTLGWPEGFIQYHTESSSGANLDSYSVNSHLAVPIKSTINGKNFITLHFCSKTKQENIESDWPKGSYCINKFGNNCANGFVGGRIHIDEEDTSTIGTFSGTVPRDPSNGDLQFCCRNDSSPLYPIQLPRSSPFYLYRYGGRCQQVLGMTFTEEFISFDTENTNNNDAAYPPHADGRVKDVNITLCYYEVN